MSDSVTDFLYRYSDSLITVGTGFFSDEGIPNGRIRLEVLPVIKRTKCGAWILPWYDLRAMIFNWDQGNRNFTIEDLDKLVDQGYSKKFVNLNAIKQYASNTPEEALNQFIRRRQKQVSILKNSLVKAKEALRQAKEIRGDSESLGVEKVL